MNQIRDTKKTLILNTLHILYISKHHTNPKPFSLFKKKNKQKPKHPTSKTNSEQKSKKKNISRPQNRNTSKNRDTVRQQAPRYASAHQPSAIPNKSNTMSQPVAAHK